MINDKYSILNDKHSILNYKRTMLNDRIVLNNPCKLKLCIENCKLKVEYCLLNIYIQAFPKTESLLRFMQVMEIFLLTRAIWGSRTPDLRITNALLWPTELRWQI